MNADPDSESSGETPTLRPHPPPAENAAGSTAGAGSDATAAIRGGPSVVGSSRHARLLQAAADLDEISAEFAAVDMVRAMGRGARGRRARLVRPPRYLRESQPRAKYVTDPRALSMGHQDLRSAQYLIEQLDKGRVERLRRFQPKAKRKKKRRKGKKGLKGKDGGQANALKKKKKRKKKKIPDGMEGVILGGISTAAADKATGNKPTAAALKDTVANEDRLSTKPHAIHPGNMTFISRPVPHCHIEAMKFEDEFLRRTDREKKDPKLIHMMNHLLRLLEHHDHADSVLTTGSSLWSSLPVNLEEQILAPAVRSFYESTYSEHDGEGDGRGDSDFGYDDSDDGKGGGAKGKGLKGSGRARKRKVEVTATMKLDELFDLRSKTFEQQVESTVHDILAWYFAHHGHDKMSNMTVRTGRAAVVKRYEEFCNQPGGGNGVFDMAALAVRHSGMDPLSTANQMEGKYLDVPEAHRDEDGDNSEDEDEDDPNGANPEQASRDFVRENKHSEALISRKPEQMIEKLAQQSVRRRQSTAMVFQRRASLIIQKHDDVRLRTLQRLQRIREEVLKAEDERRARMWIMFIKSVVFFKGTFNPFLESKQQDAAVVKLQSLFRKRLFRTRGPVMLRVMRLFKDRLVPKLGKIRLRLRNRDADQILAFCRDVNEMGRVTWAIRSFKKHMVLSQRVFRGYLRTTRARMEVLERLWVVCEKERQEGIILRNKKRIERMKKEQQQAERKRRRHAEHKGNKGGGRQGAHDQDEEEETVVAHRKRKQDALKLLGGDISQLKRIEKHIAAMQKAEEAFREAVSFMSFRFRSFSFDFHHTF